MKTFKILGIGYLYILQHLHFIVLVLTYVHLEVLWRTLKIAVIDIIANINVLKDDKVCCKMDTLFFKVQYTKLSRFKYYVTKLCYKNDFLNCLSLYNI